MTEPIQTNGRPRWEDVLSQQERSEKRMMDLMDAHHQTISAEVTSVGSDITSLRQEVDELRAKVDKLCSIEDINAQRISDVQVVVGGVRNWIVAALAAGAFVISILK